MVKSVGITGTREGMSEPQLEKVYSILSAIIAQADNTVEFHHGDCVGADVQAAIMAEELRFRTVSHPPIKTVNQAFHKSAIIYPPAGYLERDRAIVDTVDLLIVVPLTAHKQRGSGTWYTHDYAKKKNVPRYIVFPNGDISYD